MSEMLRSPAVFTPKTMTELHGIIKNNPQATLWAGGTDIMSHENFYPNTEQKDIIDLSGISELKKIQLANNFIEAGCMVTFQQFVTTGTNVLSAELITALNETGSSIIQNNATIGGALCSRDIRYSLACYLSVFDTQVEIKTLKRKTFTSKWYAIQDLYKKDGSFALEGSFLLSKIRMQTSSEEKEIFRTIGSVKHDPENAVIIAMKFQPFQEQIARPRFYMVFPTCMYFSSSDFNNQLSSLKFPISLKKIKQMSSLLINLITETQQDKDKKSRDFQENSLQQERAKRLLEEILYNLNESYYRS